MTTLSEFNTHLENIIKFTDSRRLGCLLDFTKEEEVEWEKLCGKLDSMIFTSDMIEDKELLKKVKRDLAYCGNGGAIIDEQYLNFHEQLILIEGDNI